MKEKKSIDPGMVRTNPDAMQPRSQRLEQWEYKSILGKRNLDLSALGADGWELVSTAAQPADQVMYYFKRRKL